MLSAEGRIILVSGANRGIGRAIADALYHAGYTLSLGARRPETLEPVIESWDKARVACHHFDAEDHDTHQSWIEDTATRFGRIDGLINNAGMVIRVTVDKENDDALDRMWAVNVKAPLSMIRRALPYLRQSGHGRVINVASIAGKAVYNNNVGYAMTKFAMVALSHATRQLGWNDGVRCTALCPGFVRTDMTADVTTFPLDEMMDATDLAELVVTVLGLSNSASVAELVVNCRNDITM
jgi:NADP-dependent 3-hydroxy acid dehydrogenase YdfG